MRVALHEVSKGRRGQALPTTTVEFETGAVRYSVAETEQRPTVLGLIASGRMRPDTGTVTIDGVPKASDLRRRVALIDAPEVNDPHADITLAGVVSEELMFAGLPATPIHARRWLTRTGFADSASAPIGTISAAARVRILCELAVLRKGVEGLVVVHPDRHGGDPDGWSRIMTEFADRGFAMLVIVGGSAAAALERMPAMEEPEVAASTALLETEPTAEPEPDAEPAVSEISDDPDGTRRVAEQHADGEPIDPSLPTWDADSQGPATDAEDEERVDAAAEEDAR